MAEVSSFQLETIRNLPSKGQRDPEYHAGSSEPPSHDGSLYRRQRIMIAKNQTEEDVCVLNYEDEVTQKIWRKRYKSAGSIFQQPA